MRHLKQKQFLRIRWKCVAQISHKRTCVISLQPKNQEMNVCFLLQTRLRFRGREIWKGNPRSESDSKFVSESKHEPQVNDRSMTSSNERMTCGHLQKVHIFLFLSFLVVLAEPAQGMKKHWHLQRVFKVFKSIFSYFLFLVVPICASLRRLQIIPKYFPKAAN